MEETQKTPRPYKRQVWVNGPYMNQKNRLMYVINITADLANEIAVNEQSAIDKLVKAIQTRAENSAQKDGF